MAGGVELENTGQSLTSVATRCLAWRGGIIASFFLAWRVDIIEPHFLAWRGDIYFIAKRCLAWRGNFKLTTRFLAWEDGYVHVGHTF